MTDLNDITGGTYLLVAEFWDEYLSKPGQPFDFVKHRRGAVLELNVEDARRLVVAGAVLPHDPDAPTHAVNADGSVVELLPPEPAVTGLVIPEEQFTALRERLQLPVGASSEDFVLALQHQLAAAGPQSTDRPDSDGVRDILKWVGEDKEKAATALAGERKAKGDEARPTLVAELEKLLSS